MTDLCVGEAGSGIDSVSDQEPQKPNGALNAATMKQVTQSQASVRAADTSMRDLFVTEFQQRMDIYQAELSDHDVQKIADLCEPRFAILTDDIHSASAKKKREITKKYASSAEVEQAMKAATISLHQALAGAGISGKYSAALEFQAKDQGPLLYMVDSALATAEALYVQLVLEKDRAALHQR